VRAAVARARAAAVHRLGLAAATRRAARGRLPPAQSAPAPLSAPDAFISTAAFVDENDADVRLHRLLAELEGATTVPRKNGELVFEAPWQGRVFAMAVALSEQGLFPWEEFRQALIVEVAAAEARCGEFRYYEAWLAAFEKVLIGRRIVSPSEVEENAYQFEFGERDDIF
jgi:nitrile hydratase accessory protein